MTFKSIFKNEDMSKELDPIYKKANCTDSPSEWFFPAIQKGRPSDKPGSNLYKAYSVCANCKVKKECLDFSQLSSTLMGLNYLRIYFSLKVFVDL